MEKAGEIDFNKLKLLIQASNKQRLQSSIENFSHIDKNLQVSETAESSVLNKTVSPTRNFSSEKTVSRNNLKVLGNEVNSSLNGEELSCQSSPLRTDYTESINAFDLDMAPNYGQSNLDDVVDTSDSEDLLCAISKPTDESLSDDDDETIVKLSTELQDSDPKSIVFDDLSLWEKQTVPALQIGSAIPPPALTAEEAGFSKHVLWVLKDMKFFGPSCIQSVVWPSIDRGRDIVVIAPPHSGKTVSYVLPLVSRFTGRTSEQPQEESFGPSSIILCSSWVKCQAVQNYFHLFLDKFKMKIVTLCTEGGIYKTRMQSLISKCDVLIGTPHCMLKFFKENAINLSRLEYFILDDGSDIMDKHKVELKQIFVHILKTVSRNICPPQLIICAERWNKSFQIIIDKLMRSPLLYFTSFLEAAVYAKIPINVHISSTIGEKKMSLLEMLKNAGRVVICTTSVSDSQEIHHFLRRFHCKSYVVNEQMEHYSMDDVIKAWKSDNWEDNALCLVITDQCLIKMCISNVNCLIHYDIPSKSRLQFGNRFSCIGDHLAVQESSRKCVVHVLLMESEYYFAPHLVEIIEDNETPSERLLELSEKQNKEENRVGDLCQYMKAFGYCNVSSCKSRHVIDPILDKPQVVPCEGDLHGIITHIIDASHYYIRLIKYLDPVSNKTVSLTGAYAKVGFQLRDFYMHASEEMKVETPIVGECYVLQEETKVFYRIKILDFIPETPSHLAYWKVLYLDEGWIKCSEKLNLYKMTDQIELPEPLAVEVYLCNVITPDSCMDWNPQTSLLVSDLIKGKEIHGKIDLCIGRSLLLDPLAVTVKLPAGYYAYPFKVNQKLFEYGHARKNKEHLQLLRKACTGRIPLPRIIKPPHIEEKVVEEEPSLEYAFLEFNEDEEVYVSSVVSPNQLYVQRAKFVECLDNLLDKLNQQVEKRKLNKAQLISKDMICAAPFHEDNRYYRAIVTDDTSYNEIQVFFVDFGDTGKVLRNDIFRLPVEFLTLPFQAIECELAGIAAPHGGWSESAVNTLYSLTRDEALDMKILLVKAYTKTRSYTAGNHYVVDLWDDAKKISGKLLEAGFGVPTDLIEPPVKTSDKSPELPLSVSNLGDESSSSSEDEDIDPEDKEITAQFHGLLAKMYAEEYNLVPKPATITEVSSDVEDILKKLKLPNVPLSNEKRDNLQKLIPKLTSPDKGASPSDEITNCVRPLITWWDTHEELNILIMLKDIKIYQLDVTDKGLSFSTVIAGVQYSTEETFYEEISSQEAKNYQSIQGINIVAKKHTPFKWKRLTKEKKNFFHIKYDLIHIDDSDNEEPTKDLEAERLQYLYGDEKSSSTDEDEKYVQPWTELSETKDIFRDLS